jgi:hypothetical protein
VEGSPRRRFANSRARLVAIGVGSALAGAAFGAASGGCGADNPRESSTTGPGEPVPARPRAGLPKEPTSPVEIDVPGRLSKQFRTLRPTRTCSRVHIRGPDGTSGTVSAPPVPAIRARGGGARVVIRYRFLAQPQACRPTTIAITVSSVEDPTKTVGVTPDGRPVPVTRPVGKVATIAPVAGPPPYQATAGAMNIRGTRSPLTTIPVRRP